MIICITGIDGCGKSTQIGLLNNFLIRRGLKTFVSKAYGPKEKAKFSGYIERVDPVSLMFLFQFFHTEQCQKALKAEKRGKIVLADRWDESYLAYHRQFGVLSDEEELRNQLNRLAFKSIKPDVTFLLQLDVKRALARRGEGQVDFFDRSPLKYHQAMADSYAQQAVENNWVVLDGDRDEFLINKDIINHLNF